MLRLVNYQDIRSRHKRIMQALNTGLRNDLEVAGNIAERAARANPGFNEDTGATMQSIENRVYTTPKKMHLIFGSRYNVARFMDQGTEPHVISTNKRGGLYFFWERMGLQVGPPPDGDMQLFSVTHPGTKPTRFLQKAAAAAKLVLRRRVLSTARNAIKA